MRELSRSPQVAQLSTSLQLFLQKEVAIWKGLLNSKRTGGEHFVEEESGCAGVKP